MLKTKPRVYLGMSGGVDSSVSALLLQREGYEVIGIFIKVWEPPNFTCSWREERRDAMRVASLLNIPLITLDLSEEYKKKVVDYMISEYQNGRTPNPDVMCNKEIKFGAFLNKIAEIDPKAFVATGHYAQVKRINNEHGLLKGVDENKDQSYFLWNLTQAQLAKILFPIGRLQKTEVRAIATKFKLPVAQKKDSQGLCFMGQIDVQDFLREYLPSQSGKVLNEAGEIIGGNDGSVFYTLGQRHGFTVDQTEKDQEPYYVISKDLLKNTITVSHKPISDDFAVTMPLTAVNWIRTLPQKDVVYEGRIRYRQKLMDCYIFKKNDHWVVEFKTKETSLPAGQSFVAYFKDECLGGGIIA